MRRRLFVHKFSFYNLPSGLCYNPSEHKASTSSGSGGSALSGRYPSKYIIGITGNIAVGKSRVRHMLAAMGADAIDADQIAHQVMMPGEPAWQAIIETFGKEIVGTDGGIHRAALGKIVFSDPAALKRLEAITHPAIRQRIDQLVRSSEKDIIVIEAIKLLEGDLKNAVDSVWVVHAAPQTQYRRLTAERKLPAEDARQRIGAQNRQADKIRQADVIIQNDGSIEDTLKQVQYQWSQIHKGLA